MIETVITLLYALYPIVQWEPPTGGTLPYAYEVFVDDTLLGHVSTNQITVPVIDFYNTHTVHVVAIDANGNRSVPSDDLQIQWIYNMDMNKDGIVGFVDFSNLAQKVTLQFGKCNDGVKLLEACP